MKKHILLSLVTFALCAPLPAFAIKPINFAGGWVIMNEYDHDGQRLHIYHSPSAQFSFGIDVESKESDDNEYSLFMARTNYLLKRWNFPEGQGNIFFTASMGVAEDDGETSFAGDTGIMADYETRRVLFQYENMLMHVSDIENVYEQSVRVGVAPYIAEYGSLHTWLMLQVDHHPVEDDQFIVTPLVRMFYGTTLWEVGVSSTGDGFLTLNYQF